MAVIQDIRTLFRLAFGPIRGDDHAQRLESFYGPQAPAYDGFRERLLHGRRELVQSVPAFAGGVWVDMGAGTGRNAEYFGDRLDRFAQVYLVDLSPSLIRVAEARTRRHGWRNVLAVHGSADAFVPPEHGADLITFSYSLTMMPDWFRALQHAAAMLRPNGVLGVVDFTVAAKHPGPGRRRQGWLARQFWRIWFERDNVHLNPSHADVLHALFEPLQFLECAGTVPYLPGLRAPYYLFVGRRQEPAGWAGASPVGVSTAPVVFQERTAHASQG